MWFVGRGQARWGGASLGPEQRRRGSRKYSTFPSLHYVTRGLLTSRNCAILYPILLPHNSHPLPRDGRAMMWFGKYLMTYLYLAIYLDQSIYLSTCMSCTVCLRNLWVDTMSCCVVVLSLQVHATKLEKKKKKKKKKSQQFRKKENINFSKKQPSNWNIYTNTHNTLHTFNFLYTTQPWNHEVRWSLCLH